MKSIWSSKALIKEGCLWRVGNGENIGVWSDPWIADEEGRFALSNSNNDIVKLNDLIDTSVMEWNTNTIEQNFNQRDIN